MWQRLHDEKGLKASLTGFRRYIRAMMPEAVLAQEITVWRPEVPPGEWALVMALAFSRHMFVKSVFRMDVKVWVECHLLAFEFFGRVTRRISLDNLKDGVLKLDIYDPVLNRDYAGMASHYGVLVDPCRQGHPKDKGYVAYYTSCPSSD